MDIGSIIGIIIGIGGILLGYIEEHGVIHKLFQASAVFIVLGGTIGATLINFPFSELKKLPMALKLVFSKEKNDETGMINYLASLSEKARKDGLLILEQDIHNCPTPFVQKGLTLVVDGIETELIRDILDREINLQESLYESSAKILEAMGGYSPTMGVLGTVMGMVSILGNLGGGDSSELGPLISAAFIATMYGVGLANIVYLPLAGRIKSKTEKQRILNEIITEGLLSIHAGENPKIIKEKLNLSLWEKLNSKKSSDSKAGSSVEG